FDRHIDGQPLAGNLAYADFGVERILPQLGDDLVVHAGRYGVTALRRRTFNHRVIAAGLEVADAAIVASAKIVSVGFHTFAIFAQACLGVHVGDLDRRALDRLL